MGPLHLAIVKLDNPIQHYAWGSHYAIAALQGRVTPSEKPEAELWIGDHAVAPSAVVESTGTTALPAWLGAEPSRTLGAGHVHLPFLTKVLAAERALSIQVHPDAEQARAGFERETRTGVAAAERCYRDPNPKHEVLIALSRFEALCGFRTDAEVSSGLAEISGAARLIEARAGDAPMAWTLLQRLQELSEPETRELAVELATIAKAGRSLEATWIGRLLAEHPGDPLVMAPLLLNPVVLAPGEGLVVPPGTVHTYVSGTGVEVMTRSDNVIRGGLTEKHVDRDELRRVTVPQARPAWTIQAQRDPNAGPESTYPTGTSEFEVRILDVEPRTAARRAGGRVAVLLCVEGAVQADGLELSRGEAALVPAGLESYEVKGSARESKVFEVCSG